MPAFIPRMGFEQRLAQLREQRAAIDARIAETEYWVATLDAIEAENVEAAEASPAPTSRRQPRRAP